MKFDKLTERSPIDYLDVFGNPLTRCDGSNEGAGMVICLRKQNSAASGVVYGVILFLGIAERGIASMLTTRTESATGVGEVARIKAIFFPGFGTSSASLPTKGAGEPRISSVAAAIASAVYQCSSACVRDDSVNLNKFFAYLPEAA